MISEHTERYGAALIHLLEFEANWARYELSDGGLVRDFTQRNAKLLCQSMREIALLDPKYPLLLSRNAGRLFDLEELLVQLEDWADGDQRWPEFYDARVGEGAYTMYEFLAEASVLLKNEFGVVHASRFDPNQIHYRRRRLLWSRHLGREALDRLGEGTVSRMSRQESIVVAGDIRKSQELMLYTANPKAFRERLSSFFHMIRQEIFRLDGVLDRFTGDGFIGYFNLEVFPDGTTREELFRRAMTFSRRVLTHAKRHFDDWLPDVRKVPVGGFGFTIGADCGRVSFDDSQNDFLCIGEPIVWATRMCDAGAPGELVVNNRLRYLFKEFTETQFSTRDCRTKNGESFIGYLLENPILSEAAVASEED